MPLREKLLIPQGGAMSEEYDQIDEIFRTTDDPKTAA